MSLRVLPSRTSEDLSMRLSRAVSLFVLILGCMTITATAATAYPIPKRAVFEGTTEEEFGDFGIWASRQDGSKPIRIADHRSSEPVLSPDGLEVAFVRSEEKIGGSACIEVMAVNGTLSEEHATPVYCGPPYGFSPGQMSWSTNGYELAFSGQTEEMTGIFVLNLKTEEAKIVADWFAWQESPTFSPDGSQIAFETTYNPKEELEPGIWVVNTDGSGLHQLTSGGEGEPSWSPDGSQIAAYAYGEEEESFEDYGGIALINSSTGETEKLLLTKDGPEEYDPHWTTGGKSLTFTRWNESPPEERPEIGEINADGTKESYILPEFFWAEEFRPQETTGGIELEPSYLLTRYEPRLHYDLQEQYFADSAAEATDGPENRILSSNKETVLAAHESPYSTPSLSMLAEPEFAYGYIDEGPEYGEDAAYLHANSELANKDYGRTHYDPETGLWWLDYWFYYYYDSQELLGVGVHEGDWEHIALRLDKEGIPDLAVYSRHGGESAACEASAVEWEDSDGNTVSPNVYIANASHANYFRAGGYSRFPLPEDEAEGNGGTVTPEAILVEDGKYTSTTAEPRWFYWTGQWGTSEGGGFDQSSPTSPARASDEWENLQAFAEASEENCDAEGLGERPSAPRQAATRQLPQPSMPEISAHRMSGGIAVHYFIPKAGAPARLLLLSVTAKKHREATRSKILHIHRRHGVAFLSRPLASGPYIAAGSTFTGRRARSETKVVGVGR